ncbi:MAG TPA: NAD+ synthase [Thermoplasmata archaeon]|nr:NAD+ synthase [Thermoplasmata archaeon]
MTAGPRLPSHARTTIERFLAAHVRDARADGAVVGLSGGIDSAVVARLAHDALGAERVTGVLMPDAAYPAPLLRETEEYAAALGIRTVVRPITEVEAAFHALQPELSDRVAVGNVKARIRMIVIYGEARGRNALVLGTGNKSELLMGYYTKWGDGGVDVLPLGDLYKTQIRELARELGLPEAILARPPTAGLWEGQTDEEELGVTYERLDRILLGLEELRTESEVAQRWGIDESVVREVVRRIHVTRHKRRLPPIPKIGLRTVGLDWRE